jgi:hypothetical protein
MAGFRSMGESAEPKASAQNGAKFAIWPVIFEARERLKTCLFSVWCPESESNRQGVATGGF